MKMFMILSVATILLTALNAFESDQIEACNGLGCMSIGWGGCADAGCSRCGGYCVNYGRPPNNNCRCVYSGKWFVFPLFFHSY